MSRARPVALVTGATSVASLGGSVALRFADRGYDVACTYRSNADGARELLRACEERGAARTLAVRADISVDADCRAAVDAVVGMWSGLNVLVNNAAVTRPVPLRDLHLIEADEFERIFAVNLIGPYQMSRAAWEPLRAAENAAIVNVSSIGSVTGKGSSIPYTTSKGALNTLTLALARAFAPQIRVNAVIPGGMLGPWTQRIMTEEQYKARAREATESYPLRRAVMPVDVAETVCWLACDAKTLTGELIRMDSGRHLN